MAASSPSVSGSLTAPPTAPGVKSARETTKLGRVPLSGGSSWGHSTFVRHRTVVQHVSSVQRRIQSLQDGVDADQFLAPLFIDETTDSPGPHPSLDSHRCSDKGFLPLPLADYLQLLDWTARQTAAGKLGSMPAEVPPIFERLSLTPPRGANWSVTSGSCFTMLRASRRRLITVAAV